MVRIGRQLVRQELVREREAILVIEPAERRRHEDGPILAGKEPDERVFGLRAERIDGKVSAEHVEDRLRVLRMIPQVAAGGPNGDCVGAIGSGSGQAVVVGLATLERRLLLHDVGFLVQTYITMDHGIVKENKRPQQAEISIVQCSPLVKLLRAYPSRRST